MNTKIPVPKVHAYSFSSTSPTGMAFIIMDFIDGQNLMHMGFKNGDKWYNWRGPTDAVKRVHQQLAEVYIELRRHEFPAIGALGLDPTGPTISNPAGVHVCHRPLSIEIAMQECEGQNPSEMFPVNKTFSSSSAYIDSLLWLSDNELSRSTNPEIDREGDGGRMLLYAVHDFRRFVTEDWIDTSKNEGSFVLMHGDMHNHYSNLLWDKDLNLLGVIDWEWSQVVPLQLFTPPVWLENTTVEFLSMIQEDFNKEVSYLVQAIQDVEASRGTPPVLSREWGNMSKWCHPLVVSTLFRPNDMFDMYWSFLSWKRFELDFYKDKEKHTEMQETRLTEYMASSAAAREWLKEKETVQDKYYDEEDRYEFLKDIKDDTEVGEQNQPISAGE